MTTNKLFMAASVAAVAVASVSAPVNAEASHTFTDVGSSYDEAVTFLFENEFLNGKSATQFGTHMPLTRGDAAVILANTIGLDTEGVPDVGFTDLNDRVKGAVNALAMWDIVSGVTATQFKPNEPLSRGAMAKFLTLGFGLEGYEAETPFTDVGGVFVPYIEALYGAEITSGKTATSYDTYANITRGEFANLLYKTYNFAFEDYYYPVVENGVAATSTSIELKLAEAVPEDYTGRDVGEYYYYSIQLEDDTLIEFLPTSYSLSTDRLTLTIGLSSTLLEGKAGTILLEDYEDTISIPFDFKEAAETPETPEVPETPETPEVPVTPETPAE